MSTNQEIENRMKSILDENSLSMINECRNQINDGGILVNNKSQQKGEVKEMMEIKSSDINMNIETEVIGEEIIDNDDGTTTTTPVVGVNATIDASMPVVDASMNTTAVANEVENNSKKSKNANKSKKNNIDLDTIENEFINNFDTMTREMRFDHLVKLCGETAASSAKKLDLKPANRILESVRGNRALKGETLDKVYNFYKNHDNLKNRTKVLDLITPEFFVG